MIKTCNRCKTEKDLSEFGKDKKCKDGFNSTCKQCCRKSDRIIKSKNRQKYRDAAKTRYWNNPEKSREAARLKYTPKPPNKNRHGKTGTRVYRIWANMLQRCENPNTEKFTQYGERGILVCEEWHDFKAFLGDMGEPPDGMTIDRIDTNGNYEKSNCRWATLRVQANNKTNNRVITFNGKTMTTAQWARETEIPFTTIRMRLHRGWSIQKTLTQTTKRK